MAPFLHDSAAEPAIECGDRPLDTTATRRTTLVHGSRRDGWPSVEIRLPGTTSGDQ
ncbi:MAG TPA: hypothetical protein V6D08_02245 [Candidatus Obscuribacterales bacterium]